MHMNAQDWAVAAIVTAAALYALWYWLPASLRRRLGAVRPALAKKPGCGSCSSCGGCGSSASNSQNSSGSDFPGNTPAYVDCNPASTLAQKGAERKTVWMSQKR